LESEFDADGRHACRPPLAKESHGALYEEQGRVLLSGILHFKLASRESIDTPTFLHMIRQGASLESLTNVQILQRNVKNCYNSPLLRAGPGVRAMGLRIPPEIQEAHRLELMRFMLPALLEWNVPRDLVLMCAEYATLS
jgi:hypothetical protein